MTFAAGKPLMRSGFVLALLMVLTASSTVDAAYSLGETYSSPNFFDGFDFYGQWSHNDPTKGYVYYVDGTQASDWGLITANSTGVYIMPDSWSNSTLSGRAAVRIQSKTQFNAPSLFIADIVHMPYGCGTWPSYWLNGPNPWPTGGEIDIIEGVHWDSNDKSTLHTTNGCDMSSVNTSLFTGTWDSYGGTLLTDCFVNATVSVQNNGGNSRNLGCGIYSNQQNFGWALNQRGGGIYATEWTTSGIKLWFFGRDNIPNDIVTGSPDPNSWLKPYAYFPLGNNCSPSHFHDMNIIINLTFCGDWAGGVWGSTNCSTPAYPTCESFVQYNPSQFSQAFWHFNSIKVYH